MVIFRKSSSVNMGHSSLTRNRQLDVKRIKTEGQGLVDKTTKSTGKMIELDLVSSDEDFWNLSVALLDFVVDGEKCA
jgi:minichromosome maintenance protein 10